VIGAPLRFLRRRPVLAAAIIFFVLSVLLVLPALLPGKTLSNSDIFWFQPPWQASRPPQLTHPSNPEIADAPSQLQPFLQYTISRLPSIPLWNPYIVGGRPFLANAQSAIFSPYSLPAYVLPFFTSLGWIAVMKFWVAAFGMFLLCRALGIRFGGALLAGIVYAFNLWMVTWVTYPHMSVWTWIPWMMLLADRCIKRPDLLGLGGLSAVTAAQFLSGHPESSFHLLVATGLFSILRLWQTRAARGGGLRGTLRPVLTLAGGLIGGALLSALVLLPFAQLLLNSADIHQRAGAAIDYYPPGSRKYILEIFLPDYWGRPTQTPLALFLLARAFYAGALPLMLAASALILRPKAWERWWVALFGFTGLGVVLGIPPFLQIVTHLPIFSSGHNSRLVIWYMLALSLLAGWGMDDVTARVGSPRAQRLVIGASAALLLAPALWLLGARRITNIHPLSALNVAWGFAREPSTFLDPANADIIRLASLIVWLTLAGIAVVLVVLRLRGRLPAAVFVALAAVLVAGDLFRAGMGYNPAIDQKYATQPATPAIKYLEAQRPARFVTDADDITQNVIPMRYHLYEARGYDLPVMQRYDRLWRSEFEPQFPSQVSPYPISIPLTAIPNITARGVPTLRLLGVRDILQSLAQPILRLRGVHMVYHGADARVYQVDGALPRAFVVSSQQVVSGGDAALSAVTSPGFDARGVVVTEKKSVAGVPQAGAGTRPGPAGSAQLVTYEPEHVVVRATLKRPGMLILDDNYDSGWNATVDGHSAPVRQVDYIFRGVVLPPGTHTVQFRYQPATWTIGWIVSVTSFAGLVLVLAVGWRRRRRMGRLERVEALAPEREQAPAPA
jgi:Bacterial membrane protein YfhO